MDLTALDGTTARSVAAFLERRHQGRFELSTGTDADVLLVDLDRPGADAAIAAAGEHQVVLGVGFDPEPAVDGTRAYVQKPLTGVVVTEALAGAAALVGVPRSTPRPTTWTPPTRARDVFRANPSTPGPRSVGDPPRRRGPVRDWSAPPPARLDRAVFARAESLAEAAAPSGTTGGAAERLSHRHRTEPVPACDGGDLHDPRFRATVTYDPGVHLDGTVARLLRDHPDRSWQLRDVWGRITHDAEAGTVLVTGGETALRTWCHQAASPDADVRWLRHVEPDARAWPLRADVALWNLAVWCSQGRLPTDMDPFAPVQLAAWPDLTRCALTPSVMPVVAVLTGSPRRPVDVADVVGASRSHVFVVLAAAQRAGLLAAEAPQLAAVPAPAVDRPHRSVVRRLLGRLAA